MKILALEAYYGGSHKAFLDALVGLSRHRWDIYKLPASKWKWRMRHSAITFAEQVAEEYKKGKRWDLIFATDMLNLAEFLGLVGEGLQGLPKVIYFHENQLTYPVQFESERDYQFAMTNMTSALAGDEVWFNSQFGRDSFIGALEKFLKKMPDFQPVHSVQEIFNKSKIYYPGVIDIPRKTKAGAKVPRILWAARWEHDKRPEDFFSAMKIFKDNGGKFILDVIGAQFRDCPEIFSWAEDYFADEIGRWGYQNSFEGYLRALQDADIFVSTAGHEFFGMAAVEASLAGAYPLLPDRLAYPEVFKKSTSVGKDFFYDGSVGGLADKLTEFSEKFCSECLWDGEKRQLIESLREHTCEKLTQKADKAFDFLARQKASS